MDFIALNFTDDTYVSFRRIFALCQSTDNEQTAQRGGTSLKMEARSSRVKISGPSILYGFILPYIDEGLSGTHL
jgi:hypothetical protein